MCSTNVPNRRRSTGPTWKAGSRVRLPEATSRSYNVICSVNDSLHSPRAHVEELGDVPGAAHRDQADLLVRAELMGPDPATHPVVAVATGVGLVQVLAWPTVDGDAQPRGVAGRADHSVAVPRELRRPG